MPVLGRMALAVVAGGVALGTMLGAAANPTMKRPPEQAWRGGLQAPVTADAGYLTIEAPPRDLSPYQDSYAPTWAREEMTDWEPDYPAWTYSDLVDERFADVSPAAEPQIDEQMAAAAPEATAPEAPDAPDASPEPVAPPDLPVQPAGAAPYPRLAAHLDDLY